MNKHGALIGFLWGSEKKQRKINKRHPPFIKQLVKVQYLSHFLTLFWYTPDLLKPNWFYLCTQQLVSCADAKKLSREKCNPPLDNSWRLDRVWVWWGMNLKSSINVKQSGTIKL